MSQKIEMGLEYMDGVTGFIGVCTGHCEYLTGCDQCLLTPKVDDNGAHRDGVWFDSQRLRRTASETKIVLDNSRTPGHDKPAPIK